MGSLNRLVIRDTYRMTRPLFALLVLAFASSPGPVSAQVRGMHLNLTPYGGMTLWDDGTNLEENAVFGGRLGLMFSPHVGIEGTYGYVPAETMFGPTIYARPVDVGGPVTADLHHYGADILVNLAPSSVVSPYLLAGYQQVVYKSDAPLIEEDNTFDNFEAAAGLIARLAPRVALRGEFRDVILSFDSPAALTDESQHNFFITLGLQVSLGGQIPTKDQDGDGVADEMDTCPGTPVGVLVDAHGCPIDGDQDGVPDGLDQCAATPVGARVDASGCPQDADKDGVYDGIDQCENTLAGIVVDARGCPMDADKDGVPDGTDACPNTPVGATVDATGCPVDTDKDGVPDGLDLCANTPAGARVDKDGCPIEVSEKETELLDTGKITVRDINFETAKWNILPESYRVLDEVGTVLVQWPELRIEIGGHADARGSDSYNLDLSQKRAQAVLDYLIGKFPAIKASQYTAKGYGESQPVASNSTVEGMAKNRRVEFKVLNTEVLKKEIERRRTLKKDE